MGKRVTFVIKGLLRNLVDDLTSSQLSWIDDLRFGVWRPVVPIHSLCLLDREMGVSENRGPQYCALNTRILIIRTPKQGTP